MEAYRVFNVKAGLPTLEEARVMLLAELRAARHEGVRTLKVIHGYGASGKGGKLRVGLRQVLAREVKLRHVRAVIPGERFSIFNPAVLPWLDAVPELRRDPDLNACNEGITLVMLG